MLGWCLLIGLAWGLLQARPSRKPTWQRRWKALQRFGVFLSAAGTLAWWTFLKEPGLALWKWERRRSAERTAHRSLDETIDRLLGR